MSNKLYVGNLPFSMTEDALTEAFKQAGTCISVKIIKDGMSGRSKGFGFIEMATPQEAQDAIQKLNGVELEGRKIVVSEARPEKERPDKKAGGFGGKRRY
jgi:RNA recognition motif-containing protein